MHTLTQPARLAPARRAGAWLSMLTLAALLSGCSEPRGPIPGGELRGTEQPVPDDWSFTAATEDFQLETQPSDPYSVNVWAVDIGAVLYVAAGGGGTTWAQYMQQDPNVRLRDGDAIYPLQAQLVTDIDELLAIRKRFEAKYDLGEIGDDADDALVFALTPRVASN